MHRPPLLNSVRNRLLRWHLQELNLLLRRLPDNRVIWLHPDAVILTSRGHAVIDDGKRVIL